MKFEEIGAITIAEYQNTFIYFLLRNGVVVYVGQTKQGLIRPFTHKYDKEYDEIKIIYCKEKALDMLEDKYIEKYKPIYNKTFNLAMNYSLYRTREKIREMFENKITIPILKKIISELEIEIFMINGNSYIKRKDFERIVDYLKKAKG